MGETLAIQVAPPNLGALTQFHPWEGDFSTVWDAPQVDLETYQQMFVGLQESREALNYLHTQNLTRVPELSDAQHKIAQLKNFAAYSLKAFEYLQGQTKDLNESCLGAFNEAHLQVQKIADAVNFVANQVHSQKEANALESARLNDGLLHAALERDNITQDLRDLGQGVMEGLGQLRADLGQMKFALDKNSRQIREL